MGNKKKKLETDKLENEDTEKKIIKQQTRANITILPSI